MLLFIVVYKICPLMQEHFLCWPLWNVKHFLHLNMSFRLFNFLQSSQRQIQGEGWGGCNPPFRKFSNLSGYPCLSLFHAKNNIITYNVSSSQIDHYKNTVAIPLLVSLIIQMQGRFSDEDCHARHLLCVVPSTIVNKALHAARQWSRRHAVLGERYSISQIPWKLGTK